VNIGFDVMIKILIGKKDAWPKKITAAEGKKERKSMYQPSQREGEKEKGDKKLKKQNKRDFSWDHLMSASR